ncbi:hypothetical protein ACFLXE_01340 [Chloroflexota bacterium]
MSEKTFQWSFLAVAVLALLLIILSAIGVTPGWLIAIAIVGGIAGEGVLLHYWGKDYMSRL